MRDNITGKIYCNNCKMEIAEMDPQPWGWGVVITGDYDLTEDENGVICSCGTVENIEQYEEE